VVEEDVAGDVLLLVLLQELGDRRRVDRDLVDLVKRKKAG
jgi:hypothetical protein